MNRLLLVTVVLVGCQEFRIGRTPKGPVEPTDTDIAYGICGFRYEPQAIEAFDTCGPYEVRGFNPWVEWEAGRGKSSRSTPVVADLDGDGMPEVLLNVTGALPGDKGELWAIRGDGSDFLWKRPKAELGYGSSVAVGDLDGDGDPEIVTVRAKTSQSPIGRGSKYALVIYDHEGTELSETAGYGKNDFDYASAPIISDMNHDGSPEIVVGRVIFHADGTERAKGSHGRGSWGIMPGNVSEATVSAVADLDLDGTEEVIVGNAIYSIDGEDIWHGPQTPDGMVAVANLDDDPEGEFIVSSFGSVRAHDTDGTRIWGRVELECVGQFCDTDGGDGANIVSVAAVGDVDNDGRPEILVAGGSQLIALNHDGTFLWEQQVTDVSGASGASVFDFEGDGTEEVVYLDEDNVYAFDGLTGTTKFYSERHNSDTMMDYPVVADVDADGSAEIIAAHANYGFAVTVYGQGDGRWAPTRRVWNQHAYARNHVNDDLTIPVDAVPSFTDHNTYHSATDEDLYDEGSPFDLTADIRQVCEIQCDLGDAYVAVQINNHTADLAVEKDVPVSLYVVQGEQQTLIDTQRTTGDIPAATSSEMLVFTIPADIARTADAIRVVADDNGRGNTRVPECIEDDNAATFIGPFCL